MALTLSEEWVPTQAEYDAFAEISSDDNPIHVDPAFCARIRFGRTVAHGMYIYSKLWLMLKKAQPDVRQITQNFMFPAPCFVGDYVTLEVQQTSEKTFSFRAIRQSDNADLLIGETEVA